MSDFFKIMKFSMNIVWKKIRKDKRYLYIFMWKENIVEEKDETDRVFLYVIFFFC